MAGQDRREDSCNSLQMNKMFSYFENSNFSRGTFFLLPTIFLCISCTQGRDETGMRQADINSNRSSIISNCIPAFPLLHCCKATRVIGQTFPHPFAVGNVKALPSAFFALLHFLFSLSLSSQSLSLNIVSPTPRDPRHGKLAKLLDPPFIPE